jgi:uncharacterized protein YegP (UPF0339 family)
MLIAVIVFIVTTIISSYIAINERGALTKANAENEILKKMNKSAESDLHMSNKVIEDLKAKLSVAQDEILKLSTFSREIPVHELNGSSNGHEDSGEVSFSIEEELDKLMDQNSEPMKEKMPYFEFFLDANENFRWNFKGKNNKIIADSGEGYKAKQNLRKGLGVFLESS